MKRSYFLLIIMFILLSCEKEFNITQPTISVNSDNLKVSESIELSVVEYAEIDGVRQEPKDFQWSILGENEVVLYNGFENISSITWTPDSAGYFIIQNKIIYGSNKSYTAIKDLEITESPQSLQNKLIGSWSGKAVRNHGPNWDLELTFEPDGYCSGMITNEIPDNDPCLSIFYSGGTWYFDENNVGIGCDGNSNYTGQRILIETANNNIGKGEIWISFGYVYGNKPVESHCVGDIYNVENIYFNDNDHLEFTLKTLGNTEEIVYHLERIN